MTRNVAKASNVAQQRQTMNSRVLKIMNDDEKRCEGFKRCAASNVAQQRQTMNNSALQVMNDDEKRCEATARRREAASRCAATTKGNNEHLNVEKRRAGLQRCKTFDAKRPHFDQVEYKAILSSMIFFCTIVLRSIRREASEL